MKSYFCLLLGLVSVQLSAKTEDILLVDYRHRPPEMLVTKEGYRGPLVDIVRELAKEINFDVRERTAHFKSSLDLLKKDGSLHLLPRTFCTKERAAKIDYLGPIGYQEKIILFLVKKGKENMINSYKDLSKLVIGVKNGTAYFERFDHDKNLRKMPSIDDFNMVKMFEVERFDTMIIVDKVSVEEALKKRKITNYSYANYKYPKKIWNYFGISRSFKKKDLLQKALEKMVKSKRVTEIYKKHGVKPPKHGKQIEFPRCFGS